MKNKTIDNTEKILEKKSRSNEDRAQKAFDLLVNSQIYKQPRMNQIARFERVYNNDVPPKLRQMFNVPIPVFAGMIDTLLADFNDQLQIRFEPRNAAQYLITPKLQAHWEAERDNLSPNARWNQKVRWDRFNAALSGRGILLNFAENDPEYKNVLEVINYSDFHCQPLGGGNIDDHLFKGREGVMKTIEDLENGPNYDQAQVEKLKTFVWSNEYFQNLDTVYGTRFSRFYSMRLDPVTNSFAGAKTYNMCEFLILDEGKWWYILFEPMSRIWVRCCPWKEICETERNPFISWATHEDQKNFWSKAFADDLYYSADAIITMFNQELTNREKKNFNARAYDKEMFTDVAKLDAAQYRPDALVPVNTKNGTRSIAAGIYEFNTPELQGTVNLIGFINNFTGQNVGVSDLSMGGTPGAKKPTVVLAQQQQVSKRIGYRSDSFKEAYAQLGLLYIEGLKEYMPPSVSVRIIGENGFIEESELRRIDVKPNQISISISSTSEQESADNLKRDSRVKAIEMIASNPNLNRWEKETTLRDVGQFDESEINFAFDTQSYSSKKQIAHASQAIQDLLLNKDPDVYYGADISYLMYLSQYMTDHKNQIKGREDKFLAFLNEMGQIVNENMQHKAQMEGNTAPPALGPDGKPVVEAPTDVPAGGGNPVMKAAQKIGQSVGV